MFYILNFSVHKNLDDCMLINIKIIKFNVAVKSCKKLLVLKNGIK